MNRLVARRAGVDLAGRRILLVAARFFGYHERILAHLARRGAFGRWVDERPYNSAVGKALVRVSPRAMAPLAERYYEAILASLEDRRFDDILFVSPEASTAGVVQRFRAQFPDARLLLYMWDAFANKGRRDPRSFIRLFDRASTFDAEDARTYGIAFRPLFYCDDVEWPPPARDPAFALSFIGTIHSDRYRILRSLCRQLDGTGLRYFAFPYVSSRLLYWTYRAVKPEFRGTTPADFRFDPMPYPEVLRTLADSAAVLDIEHPNQRGLTMRTLEVLAAGQKLVTTNAEVRSYPFFSEERVWVLDRRDPRIDPAFLRTRPSPMPASYAADFSIAAWTDEVFG